MKNFMEFFQSRLSEKKCDSLKEASPPDPDIETWITKNKERFQKEYGAEKGLTILYGKAWNMFNKRKK